MLEQKPETVPAAQIRVPAEELARAVSALEETKAAERRAGVAPIGQVVDELRLDSTPEEIWAQVQRQRAEDAARAAARPAHAAVTPEARRRVRGWRGVKGWVWVVFWCTGGLGLLTQFNHHASNAPAGVEIGGNGQTLTTATAGKPLEVSGDHDTVTLYGDCPTLTVSGSRNHIRVEGHVGQVIANGDGNTVTYGQDLNTAAPVLSGDGDGNKVSPAVTPPADR